MNTPQNDVEKDISELENLNWKISSFTFDSDRDPSEREDYHQNVTNQEWLVEKIAEKVVNDKEYATAFNNKASENIKKMINEQDLENLKHGRFYDADSWKDAFKDKANRDLEALDKGKATYEELAIDEKRKDPKYAKAMDDYIADYNAKVTPNERFNLNSYKNIDMPNNKNKEDVRFDINYRVDNFEVIRYRLQDPSYEKQFMKELEQQYNKKEITGTRSYIDHIRESVSNFKEFTQKYFEKIDSFILSKDKNTSVFPDIHQDIADKHALKRETQEWITSSRQNPEYEKAYLQAQKDLRDYAQGNISKDEMSRKAKDPKYLTAYEDNLRLNALSNPRNSLAQAEAQIEKYSIFAYRDQSREQHIDHGKNKAPLEKSLEKNSVEKTTQPDITTAKRDLENWDNNKITALELGRKLKSPEYRTAFEDAVRQTYKPGLEKEFGHFDGYKGTLQQNVEQFVKFRMQGIETTYKHAEKYQQLKLENAGKAPGINQEKDLSR